MQNKDCASVQFLSYLGYDFIPIQKDYKIALLCTQGREMRKSYIVHTFLTQTQ